jgi:mono/diheme cytochrome c family protein
MKTTKLVMLVMTIAVALFILIPNLSWAADDGATIYKAKCAMCHGGRQPANPQPRFRAWFQTTPKRRQMMT